MNNINPVLPKLIQNGYNRLFSSHSNESKRRDQTVFLYNLNCDCFKLCLFQRIGTYGNNPYTGFKDILNFQINKYFKSVIDDFIQKLSNQLFINFLNKKRLISESSNLFEFRKLEDEEHVLFYLSILKKGITDNKILKKHVINLMQNFAENEDFVFYPPHIRVLSFFIMLIEKQSLELDELVHWLSHNKELKWWISAWFSKFFLDATNLKTEFFTELSEEKTKIICLLIPLLSNFPLKKSDQSLILIKFFKLLKFSRKYNSFFNSIKLFINFSCLLIDQKWISINGISLLIHCFNLLEHVQIIIKTPFSKDGKLDQITNPTNAAHDLLTPFFLDRKKPYLKGIKNFDKITSKNC